MATLRLSAVAKESESTTNRRGGSYSEESRRDQISEESSTGCFPDYEEPDITCFVDGTKFGIAVNWNVSKVNVNDLPLSEPGGLVVVADVEAGQALAACREVFDYRPAYFEEERLHLYTLRFWEAFVFCMAFEEPDAMPH